MQSGIVRSSMYIKPPLSAICAPKLPLLHSPQKPNLALFETLVVATVIAVAVLPLLCYRGSGLNYVSVVHSPLTVHYNAGDSKPLSGCMLHCCTLKSMTRHLNCLFDSSAVQLAAAKQCQLLQVLRCSRHPKAAETAAAAAAVLQWHYCHYC
jgi:hypothetical protein